MTGPGGRAIIVTGASRGLGREIALRFGSAGENVLVGYLAGEAEARDTARRIRDQGGNAEVHRADLRSTLDVEAMVRAAVDRWGRIDVLVNNAGVARDGLALRMPEQDWDEVLDINLKGPFRCIRAVSSIMMRRRSGVVINVSSITGMQGREGQANYSSSKAGLIGLTRAAARELGRYDIRVNAVLPGFLATEMTQAAPPAVREQALRENLLGRSTELSEVAEFVYRLSLMRHVSGQVFNLDSRVA